MPNINDVSKIIYPQKKWNVLGFSNRVSTKVSLTGSKDSRIRFYANENTGVIRLLFVNIMATGTSSNETTSTNTLADITLTAAIEVDDSKNSPVFFDGKRSVVITKGGFVISDPIYLDKSETGYFNVRTRIEANGFIPVFNTITRSFDGVADNVSSLVDGVGTTGYTVYTNTGNYQPLAVLFESYSDLNCFIGDSIIAGVGDVGKLSDPYPPRVGWDRRWSYVNYQNAFVLGYPGGTASEFITFGNIPFSNAILSMLAPTKFIIGYGANDCVSQSLSAIQASFTSLVTKLRFINQSAKIYVCTVTPRTTSTDSWATEENQTPVNNFVVGGTRDQLNAWMQTSNLFDHVIDIASIVGNGNVWKAGYTADGIHPKDVACEAIATTSGLIP